MLKVYFIKTGSLLIFDCNWFFLTKFPLSNLLYWKLFYQNQFVLLIYIVYIYDQFFWK